jgi:hypothetical protein
LEELGGAEGSWEKLSGAGRFPEELSKELGREWQQ